MRVCRWIVGALVLVTSCAPVPKEPSERLKFLGGTAKWIGIEEPKLFDAPIGADVSAYVLPGRVPFSMCRTALHRAAGTALKGRDRREPHDEFDDYRTEKDRLLKKYNEHLKKGFRDEGVLVDDNGPVRLHILLNFDDVPDGLAGGPVRLCHVEAEVELLARGKQSVAWKPNARFDASIQLYEEKNWYRVQPNDLHSTFEKILNNKVQLFAPLLRGDVSEPCSFGFLKLKPEPPSEDWEHCTGSL